MTYTFKQFLLMSFCFIVLLTVDAGCSGGSDEQMPDGDDASDGDGEIDMVLDGDADDDEPYIDPDNPLESYTDDELIALGKAALVANDSEGAQGFFGELLRRDPDHDQGLWGMVLAEVEELLGLMNMVLGMIGEEDISGPGGPGNETVFKADEIDYQNPLGWLFLEDAMFDLRELQADQLEHLTKLKMMPDTKFNLKSFPVFFRQELMFELASEWDLADVYLLDALNQGLFGMLSIIYSQNLLDVPLTDILPDLADDRGEASGQDYSLMALKLLDAYPLFMDLKGEGRGEEIMEEAQVAFATLADDILMAYDLMEAEKDRQKDDVIAIGPSVRGVDHLVLQGTFYERDAEPFEAFKLLWRGDKYGLAQTAEQIHGNMTGDADTRIRLEHDLLALMGIPVDLINQTLTIEGLLEIFGFELDSEIISLIAGLGGDNGEAVPKTLISMIKLMAISPDFLELDLYAFLSRPAGFRNLLSNWKSAEGEDDEPEFFYEFECARLGWMHRSLDAAMADGGEVQLMLEDFYRAGPDPQVEIFVLRVDPEDPEQKTAVDVETVTLQALDSDPDRFTATIALVQSDADPAGTGTQEDGVLQMSSLGTDEITAVYTEDSIPAEPLEVGAIYDVEGDTSQRWSDMMSCYEDGSRDTAHFEEDSPYLLSMPDTGEAKLVAQWASFPADGYPKRRAYFPWRSGSFNNLLWVDLTGVAPRDYDPREYGYDVGYIKTDALSMNLFLEFLGAKVMGGMAGSFGGGK